MAKVIVTEQLRKELRDRLVNLTPGTRWHIIARCERESVEMAFLSIDEDSKVAEVHSDNGVTKMIYEISRGRQLLAEKTIEWLERKDLWPGTKLQELPGRS